jgi:hypothetical protein
VGANIALPDVSVKNRRPELSVSKSKTRSKSRPILPAWLSIMLASTFVVSGVTVVLLAYLTLQEAFAQPLNPLTGNPVAQAAEGVSEV